MANPTQVQIDKFTVNVTNFDLVLNGTASDTVALDSGTVKSVQGHLADLLAVNPRGAWGTTTAYALKDIVTNTSVVYICVVAHTSGTFATDLSAAKWAIYQLDVTSAITFGSDFTVDGTTLHVDSATNRVGIGITSPDGKLHILSGSAGTVTASTSADELVIEGSGATGISFLSPVGASQLILFGDTDDNDAGFIEYTHSANAFRFGTNAAERLRIDSSGNVGIGTSSPGGLLEVGDSSDMTPTAEFILNAPIGVVSMEIVPIGTDDPNGQTTSIRLWGTKFGTANRYSEIKNITNGGTDANELAFFTNASERLRVSAAGNVGIGTSSPASLLEISKDGGATLKITNSTTNQTTDDLVGALDFISADNSSGQGGLARAFIRSYIVSASGTGGYISIGATPDGNVATEKIRINGDGSIGVGATPNANAILDLSSTTKAFMPPRMTTTQRNAVASPTAGMVVYNSTTNKLNVYTTAWEAVTSA
jgi:hypothetical protein